MQVLRQLFTAFNDYRSPRLTPTTGASFTCRPSTWARSPVLSYRLLPTEARAHRAAGRRNHGANWQPLRRDDQPDRSPASTTHLMLKAVADRPRELGRLPSSMRRPHAIHLRESLLQDRLRGSAPERLRSVDRERLTTAHQRAHGWIFQTSPRPSRRPRRLRPGACSSTRARSTTFRLRGRRAWLAHRDFETEVVDVPDYQAARS